MKYLDVYYSLAPAHITCTIIGVFPCSLRNYPSSTKSRIYHYDKLYLAYSTTVTILLLTLCTYTIVDSFMNFLAIVPTVQNLVVYVSTNAITVNVFLFLILGCVYSKNIMKILHDIKLVDDELISMGFKLDYKKPRNLITLIIVARYTILTMLTVYGYLDGDPFIPIVSIPDTASVLLDTTIMNQFAAYMIILAQRFQILNNALYSVGSSKRFNGGEAKNRFNLTENNRSVVWKKHERTIYISNRALILTGNRLVADEKIERLCRIHGKLYNTCKSLNKAFSIQILLKFTITFINILSLCFYLYSNYPKMLMIPWALWAVAAISLVCVSCTVATYCANNFGYALHKVKAVYNNFDSRKTIKFHSIHAQHRKVQFKVCNLFDLSNAALYSMVTGISTCFVILIQFSESSNSK